MTTTRDAPHPAMVDVNALRGLPLAALWCLYGRAAAASRDRSVHDHVAGDALERLALPCASWFGAPSSLPAERAAALDRIVAAWAVDHPGGLVVSLGDGLDTGFWRHDNGALRWLSIDLRPILAMRARVLPRDPRQRDLCMSAFDTAGWFPHVDANAGVFVLASGLFSFFHEHEVRTLVTAIAERFPWAEIAFDVAAAADRPAWCLGTADGAALRWRPDARARDAIASWHPNLAACTDTHSRVAQLAKWRAVARSMPWPTRLAALKVVHLRCRPAAARPYRDDVHADDAWEAAE